MGSLGIVELQGAGERLEHTLGRAGQVPALDPDVVVDRDTGQQRHLFPPQPLHPAVAAVHGQAGLLRGQACTPGAEELLDLGSVVHAAKVTDRRREEGGTGITWIRSDSRAAGT